MACERWCFFDFGRDRLVYNLTIIIVLLHLAVGQSLATGEFWSCYMIYLNCTSFDRFPLERESERLLLITRLPFPFPLLFSCLSASMSIHMSYIFSSPHMLLYSRPPWPLHPPGSSGCLREATVSFYYAPFLYMYTWDESAISMGKIGEGCLSRFNSLLRHELHILARLPPQSLTFMQEICTALWCPHIPHTHKLNKLQKKKRKKKQWGIAGCPKRTHFVAKWR